MNKHVAIIGASAAGLLTAKMLSEQGLNVKVLKQRITSIQPLAPLLSQNHLPKC